MSLSEAELYVAAFENPNPKYYTMVPNIVDHLTYDEINEETGEKITKRLSVYAIQLYRIIINIAGDGACWQKTKNLAELCNMSAGSVSNAKKELQKSFNEFDGKPLIVITKQKKKSDSNWTEYDKIIVSDIWRHNNAFMTLRNYRKTGARSPNESAGGARSPNESAQEGARSPGETNNNKNNKNPLFKEQQPAADAAPVCPVVSLDANSSVPSEPSKEEDVKLQALNFLLKMGFEIIAATEILKKFSPWDIQHASTYLKKQIEKKRKQHKCVDNPQGYLFRILEGRWWLDSKIQGV